jgi:hypothetical protein
VVVPAVAEALETLAQPAREARLDALARLERAQRLEVEVAPRRLGVEDAELGAPELERVVLPAEHAVARHLDGEGEDARLRAALQHRLGVMAVEPLDGNLVQPERRLARRVPEQVDAAPGPLLGHGRARLEPVRGPERPEALAELGRPQLEPVRLVERDPVGGAAHEQLVERARVRPDERP